MNGIIKKDVSWTQKLKLGKIEIEPTKPKHKPRNHAKSIRTNPESVDTAE